MVAVAIAALSMAVGSWLVGRSRGFWVMARHHRLSQAATAATVGPARTIVLMDFTGHPVSREANRWHALLAEKYIRAARYPWLPVAPDPPEPE
jgi:hypothetical protein